MVQTTSAHIHARGVCPSLHIFAWYGSRQYVRGALPEAAGQRDGVGTAATARPRPRPRQFTVGDAAARQRRPRRPLPPLPKWLCRSTRLLHFGLLGQHRYRVVYIGWAGRRGSASGGHAKVDVNVSTVNVADRLALIASRHDLAWRNRLWRLRSRSRRSNG